MSTVKPQYDTIGTDGLAKIYDAWKTLDIVAFREYCCDLVENSRSPREKKDAIIRDWMNVRNKNTLLLKANNFALAGEGLKVCVQ